MGVTWASIVTITMGNQSSVSKEVQSLSQRLTEIERRSATSEEAQQSAERERAELIARLLDYVLSEEDRAEDLRLANAEIDAARREVEDMRTELCVTNQKAVEAEARAAAAEAQCETLTRAAISDADAVSKMKVVHM